MHYKLHEWGKRYLPAEIISTVTGLSTAFLMFHFTGNRILAAFFGTWAENGSYYVFLVWRDTKKVSGFQKFLKKCLHIVMEFGPAEVLDTFVMRPFFLYLMPLTLNNFPAGIIVGKIIADVLFYVPTIIIYELRKKHWKE